MLDLASFIKSAGYLGLFGIIFAESGFLLGIFFPGDSLLFTAGILASQGYFDVRVLAVLVFVAAVLGDNFGYAFGYRAGPRIFKRDDSLLFHKDHLERAERFYKTHGGKTIILARFMPIIRTFAPILAGVGKMHYPTFFIYNVIGGVVWGIGGTLLGYFFGNVVPDVDRYIIPIIIFIVLTSVLPAVLPVMKNKERRDKIKIMIKEHRARKKRIRAERRSPKNPA